jgi:DNA-binding NarL/FixJ family response regulator
MLADDHAVVREGLRRLLTETKEFEVVAEASDGTEAVALAKQLRPRLVLMDISMPGLNGIDATRLVKAYDSDVAVVYLTVHESEQYFLEALRSGAEGYVPKSAPASEVIEAARSAARGQVYLHPSVARFLLQTFLNRDRVAPSDLSAREEEVLHLVAGGLTTQEMADRLAISPHTVHRHRTSLMQKLGLHDRLDLLRYCIHRGLVDPQG